VAALEATGSNLHFEDNLTSYGGAIGLSGDCHLDLTDCVFKDNLSQGSGTAQGGALSIFEESFATLQRVYFIWKRRQVWRWNLPSQQPPLL